MFRFYAYHILHDSKFIYILAIGHNIYKIYTEYFISITMTILWWI